MNKIITPSKSIKINNNDSKNKIAPNIGSKSLIYKNSVIEKKSDEILIKQDKIHISESSVQNIKLYKDLFNKININENEKSDNSNKYSSKNSKNNSTVLNNIEKNKNNLFNVKVITEQPLEDVQKIIKKPYSNKYYKSKSPINTNLKKIDQNKSEN